MAFRLAGNPPIKSFLWREGILPSLARIIHEGSLKRGFRGFWERAGDWRGGCWAVLPGVGAAEGAFGGLAAAAAFRARFRGERGRRPESVRGGDRGRESVQVLTAPTEMAMRRQSSANGAPSGRWTTTRRTDDSTHAPSLSRRSRRVPIWARAQPVPLALSRSSCISTQAAAVISARNWLARKPVQLVRSICRPCLSSLIRFSASPRPQ